ncbi:glycosyltransferase family 34 protein [Xylona heveae TC161]|uniref:Glycosyltransferase family 34 protein n=1 Tax=Xylona heveae (strain CBS 132557 / TC161) TaxID=1328760 RepID=A0A164ZZ46_XYLHT|nr:glycosyltransferase family 34 protein [Xylona heveae TC161]KZF19729.1 glycosyltransferase family 34 protein [Xylona heveae TC161]
MGPKPGLARSLVLAFGIFIGLLWLLQSFQSHGSLRVPAAHGVRPLGASKASRSAEAQGVGAAATKHHQIGESSSGGRRITKATMLYGPENELLESALKTHQEHGERWGYPVQVLRYQIARARWSKPSYLLSLLVRELAKSPEERTEWIMWFDADTILINPSIPVDIFLPPPFLPSAADLAASAPSWYSSGGPKGPPTDPFAHIHLIASRDQNSLTTGVFFIRVSEWSIRMLTKAMAFPMYVQNVELGINADQVAMAYMLNDPEFRAGAVYQPRTWFNAYELHDGFEGKPGDMLVHFPGLDDDRWPHMAAWFEGIARDKSLRWNVPLDKTPYLAETKAYWDEWLAARSVRFAAEAQFRSDPQGASTAFNDTLAYLRFALDEKMDEPHTVRDARVKMEIVMTTGGQESQQQQQQQQQQQ